MSKLEEFQNNFQVGTTFIKKDWSFWPVPSGTVSNYLEISFTPKQERGNVHFLQA